MHEARRTSGWARSCGRSRAWASTCPRASRRSPRPRSCSAFPPRSPACPSGRCAARAASSTPRCCRRAARRRDARLSRRRRAGDRGAGLRHREQIARVDKIVGPGTALHPGGQAPGLRPGRDRLRGRAERGLRSSRTRARARSTWPPTCSRRPSTTSSRASCSRRRAPRSPARCRAELERQLPALSRAASRGSRSRDAQRADRDARPRARPASSPTATPPSTCRSASRIPSAGSADRVRRRDLPGRSYSPVPIGDYTAGPSHVLPTGGTARFFSVVGVEDFQRRMSLIEICERRSSSRIGPAGSAAGPTRGPGRARPRARDPARPEAPSGPGAVDGHAPTATVSRKTARDGHHGRAAARRVGRGPDRDRHAVLRPPARLVHAPRAVRPARARQGRPAGRPAPHGRGRRHRARPDAAQGDRRRRGPAPLRLGAHPDGGRADPRRPRPVEPALPRLPGRAAARLGRRTSTRRWSRTSCTRSARTAASTCTSSAPTGTTCTTSSRASSRAWAARSTRRRPSTRASAARSRPRARCDARAERVVARRLRHGEPAQRGAGVRADRLRRRDVSGLGGASCAPRTRIVLPGVGSARDTMAALRRGGLDDAAPRAHRRGSAVPRASAWACRSCSTSADEGGLGPCLGVIPGRVERFPESLGLAVPHMGWNFVKPRAAAPGDRRRTTSTSCTATARRRCRRGLSWRAPTTASASRPRSGATRAWPSSSTPRRASAPASSCSSASALGARDARRSRRRSAARSPLGLCRADPHASARRPGAAGRACARSRCSRS